MTKIASILLLFFLIILGVYFVRIFRKKKVKQEDGDDFEIFED